jgi:hypothetical protein
MRIRGYPDGGHTLQQQIQQMDRLDSKQPTAQTVHVTMGDRGHGYAGDRWVIVDKRRCCETSKRIWLWIKCWAPFEPTIEPVKSDHRLQRNALRCTHGDSINALLRAAAMNSGELLGLLFPILLALMHPFQSRRTSLCAA